MSFDVEAARQAVSRVKERSIGPTTVTDLADLLSSATARLGQLEGELTLLQSTVTSVQEHAEHALVQAHATLDRAKSERAAAATQAEQTGQIVELVSLLEAAVQSLDRTEADAEALRSEITAIQMRAQAQAAAAAAQVEELDAERARLAGVDATHAAVLERIASMSWWEAMRAAARTARET